MPKFKSQAVKAQECLTPSSFSTTWVCTVSRWALLTWNGQGSTYKAQRKHIPVSVAKKFNFLNASLESQSFVLVGVLKRIVLQYSSSDSAVNCWQKGLWKGCELPKGHLSTIQTHQSWRNWIKYVIDYIYLTHGLFILCYLYYTMLSLTHNFVVFKDSVFSKEKMPLLKIKK